MSVQMQIQTEVHPLNNTVILIEHIKNGKGESIASLSLSPVLFLSVSLGTKRFAKQ